MKGIYDIRLRIQCAKNQDHAKILPVSSFMTETPKSIQATDFESDRELKLYFARRIGEMICGNPDLYVYKPGDRSPVGRCVLCGGALSYEIQEWTNRGMRIMTELAEVKA